MLSPADLSLVWGTSEVTHDDTPNCVSSSFDKLTRNGTGISVLTNSWFSTRDFWTEVAFADHHELSHRHWRPVK